MIVVDGGSLYGLDLVGVWRTGGMELQAREGVMDYACMRCEGVVGASIGGQGGRKGGFW